jgi:hypothetical protein
MANLITAKDEWYLNNEAVTKRPSSAAATDALLEEFYIHADADLKRARKKHSKRYERAVRSKETVNTLSPQLNKSSSPARSSPMKSAALGIKVNYFWDHNTPLHISWNFDSTFYLKINQRLMTTFR